MSRIVLSGQEILALKSLSSEIASRHGSSEDPAFLKEAQVYAHELPRRIRAAMNDFRLGEPNHAICSFTGFPIDEERIGTTPVHWKLKQPRSPVLEEEILLILLGSLLGECIGWATQQDGHIVHDIFPIQGHEGEQLGSGSEQLLWWHTEDAFHPYRGDYIGMMCLRNPDQVATTFCPVCDLDQHLTAEQLRLLCEPHYTIRPDESHLKKNKSELREEDEPLAASYHHIESMNQAPEKIAVFHGDSKAPYIRIDPYFMDPVENHQEAQAALDALIALIDRRLEEQVLGQGELCFIDNFRAVHGRKPFRARYDGKDRWLKRINITRDLRKSRPVRESAESRVIF
jgi:Fe(II)/alpha-ketoglutarate-dependent arginine beta-hydroxylase